MVEAAGIAQDHGWPELATRAAIACFFLSNPGAFDPVAKELALNALELGADVADRPVLQATVGLHQVWAGDWENGSALIDEALAAAGNSPGSGLLVASGFRALADHGIADREQYANLADRVLDVAEQVGSAQWIIQGHSFVAVAGLPRWRSSPWSNTNERRLPLCPAIRHLPL